MSTKTQISIELPFDLRWKLPFLCPRREWCSGSRQACSLSFRRDSYRVEINTKQDSSWISKVTGRIWTWSSAPGYSRGSKFTPLLPLMDGLQPSPLQQHLLTAYSVSCLQAFNRWSSKLDSSNSPGSSSNEEDAVGIVLHNQHQWHQHQLHLLRPPLLAAVAIDVVSKLFQIPFLI